MTVTQYCSQKRRRGFGQLLKEGLMKSPVEPDTFFDKRFVIPFRSTNRRETIPPRSLSARPNDN